jgi:hypothetical protein
MSKYDWLTKRSSRTVEHLRLWLDNPRLDPELDYVTINNFAEGISGNKEDRDSFLELVESITIAGFIPADPVVVWQNPDNNCYYVAEGNRRVLAIKLLQEPHKAPKSMRSRITKLSADADLESLVKISVAIAPSFEEAEWYIFQRHSPVGLQRKWSREQQFRYISRIYHEEDKDIDKTQQRTGLRLSELNAIIRRIKIKDYCVSLEDKFSEEEYLGLSSYRFPISTFERFIEHSMIRDAIRIELQNENVIINSQKSDFDKAIVAIIKGILSKGEDKIDSRTSPENVLARLSDIPEGDQSWEVSSAPQESENAEDEIDNEKAEEEARKKEEQRKKDKRKRAEQQQAEKNNPNRLRVIPDFFELYSSNYRLNGIFEELQRIPFRYENSIAASIRIFLDLAVKEYIEAENLEQAISSHYGGRAFRSITLQKRLEYIKNIFSDKVNKRIKRLLDPSSEYSLDTLNGYMHSDESAYINKRFLNGFWDSLFPFFEAVLDIKDNALVIEDDKNE